LKKFYIFFNPYIGIPGSIVFSFDKTLILPYAYFSSTTLLFMPAAFYADGKVLAKVKEASIQFSSVYTLRTIKEKQEVQTCIKITH